MKAIYHSLPTWVWEVAILTGYIGLFLIGVLVAVVATGGNEDE